MMADELSIKTETRPSTHTKHMVVKDQSLNKYKQLSNTLHKPYEPLNQISSLPFNKILLTSFVRFKDLWICSVGSQSWWTYI